VFGEIFDRHFSSVHRYLGRRAGPERADDLASQTFTVAFQRRATFRAREVDARPWLLGIATNLLRNDWRSEQRLLETLARIGAEPGAITSTSTAVPELDCELAAALATLGRDQRDVLFLHAWAELSNQEIATALSIPVGTVRSRLSRARSYLRSQLTVGPTAIAAAEPEKLEETR
jgi:RNA polymerase sigma-70 factor (ECF subfamily)